MIRPKITLRFGADHDDITVDGNTFVRGKLSKSEFSFVRKVIVGVLFPTTEKVAA